LTPLALDQREPANIDIVVAVNPGCLAPASDRPEKCDAAPPAMRLAELLANHHVQL
jgi:hypothetical protein